MTEQSTSYTTNLAITAAELRNPETGAAFYVTRHLYTPTSTLDTFKLKIKTSAGDCRLPLCYPLTQVLILRSDCTTIWFRHRLERPPI